MAELVIIADDLTGALDAAAPFAMRGLHTAVALSPAGLPAALATGARIVGVSTDSRECAPEAAGAAVREALAALDPGTTIFKKVDSRLKGNIEAELDAIAHDESLVIPAIPEFGRIARAGAIEGFGVTEPIDIADRLGRHAAKARIPDIANQRDIEAALNEPSGLLIGARGLAEALAHRLAPDAHEAETALPRSSAYCVIGSTDPITLAQIDDLRRTCPDLRYLPAPNGIAEHAGGSAMLTVLQATKGEAPAERQAVAEALAASFQRLAPPNDALLFVSGGATAQAVLEALGIGVLELVGEALPGMPLARAGGLTVVTKSGGFGETDSLSRLLRNYTKAGSSDQSHVG